MKEQIQEKFKEYGFDLSERQVEQFEEYFNFLVSENQKYNLTAITEPQDVIIKHFIDSVLPEKFLPKNASVVDVGSGAGFPGLPLKILRPDIKLTMIDSLQKRVNFLEQLCARLSLTDTRALHCRAEDFAMAHREKFDVALSRAVANVATLAEYLLPLVKVGGIALMYKSARVNEEISESSNAIPLLGGKISQLLSFSLTEVQSERKIVEVQKISRTPEKYPRGKNLPKLKPLK